MLQHNDCLRNTPLCYNARCRTTAGEHLSVGGFKPRSGDLPTPERYEEKEMAVFRTPHEIGRALDRVLHTVTKPARYTGGELNSIVKDWSSRAARTKIALAFPDIYELGGSNLGLMILYDLINRRDDLLAERVYCPWPDFETIMRRDGIPLFRS